jgi:hypothetical protein
MGRVGLWFAAAALVIGGAAVCLMAPFGDPLALAQFAVATGLGFAGVAVERSPTLADGRGHNETGPASLLGNPRPLVDTPRPHTLALPD